MKNISKLLASKQTIFSNTELYDIFSDTDKRNIDNFLYRAKKNKILLNLRNGIRALPNYNHFELVCQIRSESYVSCETVLFKEGIFFQFYGNTVSCVANDSRKYKIDGKNIIYYKIKSEILLNPIGIRDYENYRIATAERALCDYIYLNPHGVIDAPENINQIRLKQILPIYPKKTILYIQKLLDVE